MNRERQAAFRIIKFCHELCTPEKLIVTLRNVEVICDCKRTHDGFDSHGVIAAQVGSIEPAAGNINWLFVVRPQDRFQKTCRMSRSFHSAAHAEQEICIFRSKIVQVFEGDLKGNGKKIPAFDPVSSLSIKSAEMSNFELSGRIFFGFEFSFVNAFAGLCINEFKVSRFVFVGKDPPLCIAGRKSGLRNNDFFFRSLPAIFRSGNDSFQSEIFEVILYPFRIAGKPSGQLFGYDKRVDFPHLCGIFMVAPCDGDLVPLARLHRATCLSPDSGTAHFDPQRRSVGNIRVDPAAELIVFYIFFCRQVQFQFDRGDCRFFSIDIRKVVPDDFSMILIEVQCCDLLVGIGTCFDDIGKAGCPVLCLDCGKRNFFAGNDPFRIRRDHLCRKNCRDE